MSINVEIVNEITLDGSTYKYFIYKKLDYISTDQLISIDPRGNSDFIDVPLVDPPLGYEYLSDGVTKFVIMALYKVFEDNTIQLSAVFRSEDYYDSALFTKMTVNVIVTGVIKDQYTINQIKIQLLDHNNQPYTIHGIDPDSPGGLVAKSLIAADPDKIHYNKDLTRLIKSTSYINPKTNIEVRGSNVIVDNDLIRTVAYVNTLEDGETPVIYNNDFVGQIIESANQLDASTMQTANLLYCPPGGAFIDNETYPELASEIGDIFLYDYELYAKIVEVGGTVSEHKYSDLSPEQIPLIVEEYYVSTPATPQENKTKLPAKEFLGPDNNVHYYIKFTTSLNTINKLLVHDVNGITPDEINNSIQLTTTNIPQGSNLYYQDSYLNPIRTRLDELEDKTINIVSTVNEILPDDYGNITLTAGDVGAASEQYVQDQISSLNLNKFLGDDTQINNLELSYYDEVLDPDDLAGTPLINGFVGFHLDSKDIYYEKDIDKNPNDISYAPQTVYNIIEGILDNLANNNVSSVNTKTGAVILVESDIPSISETYQLLTPTANVNINNYKLLNVATPVIGTDGVNKDYVDIADNLRYKLDGTSLPTASLNMNINKIVNVVDPTDLQDVATKNYVDIKVNPLDTKFKNFGISKTKSGLNVVINSDPTALTNITQYFQASQTPTNVLFGTSISGLSLSPTDLVSVGAGANMGFKFNVVDGMPNILLRFSLRLVGTITGLAGTSRELIFYLRRISDNSVVNNVDMIKVNDNNFNGRSVSMSSFINGPLDPFITQGFYIDLLNNSGADLTINTIELLIQAD